MDRNQEDDLHATTAGAWPAPFAPSGRSTSVLCALLGLCLCAVPAAAQQTMQPAAPARSGEALAEPGFWERLRAEARRFRELNANPFSYARRYRISHELASSIHDAARNEGSIPSWRSGWCAWRATSTRAPAATPAPWASRS
jgi:hypothetical protein